MNSTTNIEPVWQKIESFDSWRNCDDFALMVGKMTLRASVDLYIFTTSMEMSLQRLVSYEEEDGRTHPALQLFRDAIQSYRINSKNPSFEDFFLIIQGAEFLNTFKSYLKRLPSWSLKNDDSIECTMQFYTGKDKWIFGWHKTSLSFAKEQLYHFSWPVRFIDSSGNVLKKDSLQEKMNELDLAIDGVFPNASVCDLGTIFAGWYGPSIEKYKNKNTNPRFLMSIDRALGLVKAKPDYIPCSAAWVVCEELEKKASISRVLEESPWPVFVASFHEIVNFHYSLTDGKSGEDLSRKHLRCIKFVDAKSGYYIILNNGKLETVFNDDLILKKGKPLPNLAVNWESVYDARSEREKQNCAKNHRLAADSN